MMLSSATVIKSAASHKFHIVQKQTKLHYSKLMTKHQKRGKTDSAVQLSNLGYSDSSSTSIFNILHHFEANNDCNVTNHKSCDNVFFTTQSFYNGSNGLANGNGASQVAFNLGEFSEDDMKEFAKLMQLDDDNIFGGAGRSKVKACDVVLEKAQDEVIGLLIQDPKFSKTFGGASLQNVHTNVTVVNKPPTSAKDSTTTISASSPSPSSSSTSSSATTFSTKTSPTASPKNVSLPSSTLQTAQKQSKECFITSLLHREFSFTGNNHKKGKCTFEIQLFENNANILEAAAQEAAAIDEAEAQANAQQLDQQSYRITLVDVEELSNAHHFRNKWSLIGVPAAACLLIETIPAVEKVAQQQETKRHNFTSPANKKKPSRSYPSSFTTLNNRIKQ